MNIKTKYDTYIPHKNWEQFVKKNRPSDIFVMKMSVISAKICCQFFLS